MTRGAYVCDRCGTVFVDDDLSIVGRACSADGFESVHVLARATARDLAPLPTVSVGHFDNLKVDTGTVRVWLSRMTRADGAALDNAVTVEALDGGTWRRVVEYDGGSLLARSRDARQADPFSGAMSHGSVIVRETVHHGTYYAVRVVALDDMTGASLAALFAGCPYVSGEEQLGRAMNYAAEPLRITGEAEHGWTRWEVLDVSSSASRQTWIETGRYMTHRETRDYSTAPVGPVPGARGVCVHCGRDVVWSVLDGWGDPGADGDDYVWRYTCDRHDTFTADHETAGVS